MIWLQKSIRLGAKARGYHLVTSELTAGLEELATIRIGLAHLFLQHTSAALTINENADPDVRQDFEMVSSRLVPEDWPYVHDAEGPDDMPAHVKASLFGASLAIPISQGKLALGTWQGLYLCEFRNLGGPRTVLATLTGMT